MHGTTDWEQDETEAASGGAAQHLWEESWDDDDTSDDFSAQLKYALWPHPDSNIQRGENHTDKWRREELKKVDASKKR